MEYNVHAALQRKYEHEYDNENAGDEDVGRRCGYLPSWMPRRSVGAYSLNS
jgi:hypothetical protein